jgi:hypothetical protein
VKLTADTITDEQIRALRKDLRNLIRQIGKYDELARDEARADEATCTVALTDRRAMAYMMVGVAEGVHKARARCAEILNARAEGES